MTINVENKKNNTKQIEKRNLIFKVIETKPLTRITTFITKKQKKVVLEIIQDSNKVQLLTKNYCIKENILRVRIDDFDNIDKLKSHLKAQWTAPMINLGSEEEFINSLKEEVKKEISSPKKAKEIQRQNTEEKKVKKTSKDKINQKKVEYEYNFKEMNKEKLGELLRSWNVKFDIREKKGSLVRSAKAEIKRRKNEG